MKKIHYVCIVLLAVAFILTSCEELGSSSEPSACFVVGAEPMAEEPLSFNASCSELVVTFNWNFGDGGSATGMNPTHTYEDGGEYTVTLTVTSSDGKSDEEVKTITVAAPSVLKHSGAIVEDETWIEGMHLITSDVHVNGATLTIEAGATVMFASGTALNIGYQGGASGATLFANGTAEKPITFTSGAATKTSGDWDYIWFGEGASDISSLEYCIIEYGAGYGNDYGAVHVDGSSLTMNFSTVKHAQYHGVSLADDGYFQSFSSNALSEIGLFVISIFGNNAHTIGQGNEYDSSKGILVRPDVIEVSEATWTKQNCGYYIDGTLNVGSASGAALRFDPGVKIYMGASAKIYVGRQNNTFGTLIAEGTSSDRILITSSAPDLAKSPGDWDYIYLDAGASSASSFAYCDIEYGGGYSDNYGMVHVYGSGINLTNSMLTHSESKGITLGEEAMFTNCSDNVFENNASYPLEIYANHAHTIGRENSFNTGPGILVKGDKIIQAEATWLKHQVPYVVDGNLDLGSASGSKLIIEPGTTVSFSSGSWIRIGYITGTYGILVAEGDPENLITFTSSAPADFRSAGDWDGIWYYNGTASGNVLDYCLISYGGGHSGSSGNLNFHNETVGTPVISNCQITHSAAWGGFRNVSSNPVLSDNVFSNNASGDMNR